MLRRDGFRAGLREDLTNGGTPGLSVVEQLRSPAAARDTLAFEASQFKALAKAPGTYTPFSVSGIPGAVGFTLSGPGGSGINIAFSDASYYYLVGQVGGGTTAIAQLTGAARHLYHRVHA
jgi:hypothetical protein